LEWVVLYRFLLLFLICCLSFGPFVYELVAIGFVSWLCYFVSNWLVVVFGLCVFLRI
jgi:hypothetical protein